MIDKLFIKYIFYFLHCGCLVKNNHTALIMVTFKKILIFDNLNFLNLLTIVIIALTVLDHFIYIWMLFNFFKYLFIALALLGLSCDMWDVGSSV